MHRDRNLVGAQPLIGLLISQGKLEAILNGERDTIYCRYARYAQEAGATLLFFAAGGLDVTLAAVTGYWHTCGSTSCHWAPLTCPLPRVIYDRCFGTQGREEAAWVRKAVEPLGTVVVNHLIKICKLQAFAALQPYPEAAPYLPFTTPLTAESLRGAMERYPDLYLKPDALYKGKGVYRLTAGENGWVLGSREEWGNLQWFLPGPDHVLRAIDADSGYLIQEGLPLATYLGNRFDFRSLVQRDGSGQWQVTGLVARIAPEGSAITSPRSGGQTALADRALRHAFPDRWADVLADLTEASLRIANLTDAQLGPCIEMGLDMAVLADGSVKLIEVNGKPLRVSLDRLLDPLVAERIHRFPIHASACLATGGCQPATVRTRSPESEGFVEPVVGVLLDTGSLTSEEPAWQARYEPVDAEARQAGVLPVFLEIGGIDPVAGTVAGVIREGDAWRRAILPMPEVIYHRATFPVREDRKAATAVLKECRVRWGTWLLNGTNSFSKSAVAEALSFFPQTVIFTPETAGFSSREDLARMLERHGPVFAKADHGSHGADVLRISRNGTGWDVRGRFGGKAVSECFADQDQLWRFFHLLKGQEPWVLQQGILVPEEEGRVFDVRAIAQKDGRGEWRVPLVLVRRSRPGSVAANMSQGGEPLLPGPFLEQFGHHFPWLDGFEQRVEEAVLRTAEALESHFGLLGEIGVDLGLDQQGRPWVFEANTKPLHPALPDLPRPLKRLPFEYARYLAQRARLGRGSGLRAPVPEEGTTGHG